MKAKNEEHPELNSTNCKEYKRREIERGEIRAGCSTGMPFEDEENKENKQ